MPAKRRKGKQGASRAVTPSSPKTAEDHQGSSRIQPTPSKDVLVLTSDKRRGVYECDYCHADISQVPRIRCAVCPDFDLCLDCFATTDHAVAVARIRAASAAHGAVQDGPTPGISASAINHSGTHKYRVADSTRYPLFPSARLISKELGSETMSNDGMDDTEETEEKKDEEEKQEEAEQNPASEEASKEKSKMDEFGEEGTKDLQAIDAVKTSQITLPVSIATTDSEVGFVVQDDPKTVWTVEEDLRLLDAIATCGLGNWADIAEAVSGQGSSSKTAKRCMERYFDDFLGRFGHVLPAYTIVEDEDEQEVGEDERLIGEGESEPKKRRIERMSSSGVAGVSNGRRGKKLKVVPTMSLPGYEKVWPDAYLPPIPDVLVGQEVGRDHRYRAEQIFVKLVSNADSTGAAEKIRKDWAETRLNQPGGPTVLPMRIEDLPSLPGSELAGLMPRRGDFDVEWDNDAENVLADMEFTISDSPQERELKIKVIQIYNSKLDERDRRKTFLLSRGLLDYRKNQQADAKLPRDERDLVRRMRLFERLHSPEEHKLFIEDILKAKRLRKEIAQLQMYRRMGIQTLAEAEKYENDKARREIHKMSYLQKEAEAEKAETVRVTSAKDVPAVQTPDEDDITSSLWKQYRTSDRTNRRSVNRSAPGRAALTQIKIDLDGVAGKGKQNHRMVESTGELSETATDAAGSKPAIEEMALNGDSCIENAKTSPEIKTETSADEKSSETITEDPMEVGETSMQDTKKQGVEEKRVADKLDEKEMKEDDASSFPIAGMRGYDLLTKKEADLCRRLQLKPSQYFLVKKVIIQESFRLGILDKESNTNHTIVTIDVKKRGHVIDFMVKAGWISSKVAETLKL